VLLDAVIKELDLEIRYSSDALGKPISGVYISDLLSDVIANAEAGNLWLTLQVHPNIIAVASLKELAGIILVNGRQPDPETLKKAEEEQVPLLSSRLPTFELAGRLYLMMRRC